MQLQIFKYQEENQIDNLTTVEIDGEVWFVAKDVCELLEIQNVPREVASLDDDEKLLYEIRISGQRRTVNLVNESGLYALVFKSKKPTARQFRKWITKEVIPAIRKTGSYGINRLETPNFVVRFNDNWDRTKKGYFSVIGELFIRLYGRFESVGYQIPNKAFSGEEIRPDVSVGILFAKYLREHHKEFANDFEMYSHKFPGGFEVEARQYKIDLLPIFIRFVDEHWIMLHATGYFEKRDPKALDFLPKLLGGEPTKALPSPKPASKSKLAKKK